MTSWYFSNLSFYTPQLCLETSASVITQTYHTMLIKSIAEVWKINGKLLDDTKKRSQTGGWRLTLLSLRPCVLVPHTNFTPHSCCETRVWPPITTLSMPTVPFIFTINVLRETYICHRSCCVRYNSYGNLLTQYQATVRQILYCIRLLVDSNEWFCFF